MLEFSPQSSDLPYSKFPSKSPLYLQCVWLAKQTGAHNFTGNFLFIPLPVGSTLIFSRFRCPPIVVKLFTNHCATERSGLSPCVWKEKSMLCSFSLSGGRPREAELRQRAHSQGTVDEEKRKESVTNREGEIYSIKPICASRGFM